MKPPSEAVQNAKTTLDLRRTLPKSRRGGLEPAEAEAQGVRSGVTFSQTLASGHDVDPMPYYRTLTRFRSMAERAMSQGFGPENSKAIQVYLMWGGDAMLDACKNHLDRK